MKPSADELRQLIRARPQQAVKFRWSNFRDVRLQWGALIDSGSVASTMIIVGTDHNDGCVVRKIGAACTATPENASS